MADLVQCVSIDEYGSSEDDAKWDEYSTDSKNIVSTKKPRAESESSSQNSYLLAHVTSSNLSRDKLCLLRNFARSNGLNKRHCEIDLMNQHGKSWTLGLRYNPINDQAFIRGGWRDFYFRNGLEADSFYKFKLVQNGTRPLLQLCSDTIPEGNSSSTNQNKFLTLTFKSYMLTSGQLCLPSAFVSKNRITEAGDITLVDKNGVNWPSHFIGKQGGIYMAKGWRSFVAANELKAGETFTLEYIQGEGTTPMLKFCTNDKITIKQEVSGVEETETRVHKRARVTTEGGPSRCTLASNKSSADSRNLQQQPIQPCSIFDQVTKVKDSIADTLTCVRRFRLELEVKEQNLEASLVEIDVLGEKVLEVNKILK